MSLAIWVAGCFIPMIITMLIMNKLEKKVLLDTDGYIIILIFSLVVPIWMGYLIGAIILGITSILLNGILVLCDKFKK